MNTARVSLSADNFRALVQGNVIEVQMVTGAICPREVPVQISLQDIGFDQMAYMVIEAKDKARQKGHYCLIHAMKGNQCMLCPYTNIDS